MTTTMQTLTKKIQAAPRARSNSKIVTELCRFIDSHDQCPPLSELAHYAGLSPWHLHRVFKAATGLTPRAYGAAQRANRLRDELARGNSVTESMYNAGYNSSGRFYNESDQTLGMEPRRYIAGGRDVEIHFAVGECSLGSILVACSARGICAILLGDEPDELLQDLQSRFASAELIGGDPGFEQTVAQVVGFVEAPGLGLDLPLDIRGTAFQRRVWEVLRTIPPGETLSYSDIAERMGAPNAARAIAGACAANLLAVAIPCHRVVRRDGALSGYRWGVERKRALLEREAGS